MGSQASAVPHSPDDSRLVRPDTDGLAAGGAQTKDSLPTVIAYDRWYDGAEIVRDLVPKPAPPSGQHGAHEGEDVGDEPVEAVMTSASGNVLVRDAPEALDRVEVGATDGDEVHWHAASRAIEPVFDASGVMMAGVADSEMDQPLPTARSSSPGIARKEG